MIKFNNVSKKYGNITALNPVTFEIKDGQFVFIKGPSGAGKTTILKLILREQTATEGSLIVNGQNVKILRNKKLSYYRRKFGVIFQDFKLIENKTLFENVAFVLKVNGYTKKEINKRTIEILNLVGLSNRKYMYPRQVSGGEKQRAAVARALVTKPKIILADEPTGNLDKEMTIEIMKLILWAYRHGATVLFATHNDLIISSITKKRVISLKEGSLISDEELL